MGIYLLDTLILLVSIDQLFDITHGAKVNKLNKWQGKGIDYFFIDANNDSHQTIVQERIDFF